MEKKSNKNMYLPTKIYKDEEIIDVSCGWHHTLFLKKKVFCWDPEIFFMFLVQKCFYFFLFLFFIFYYFYYFFISFR